MKKNKWFVFSAMLFLIAGTAAALHWLGTHQRLGSPGIVATPIPGQVAMKIDLPAEIPGFSSTNIPESESELSYFPKDTSFARRLYTADGGTIAGTIVMMGADRTSIHKPDYCLPGQGWKILQKSTATIPLANGSSLPVAKWVIGNSYIDQNGERKPYHAVYVYWFVADHEQTPDFYRRLWWLTRDMVSHGVLQRWAYVSYYSPCLPGQEDATFDRMKTLIAASVPKFQLSPDMSPAPAIAPRQ